MIDSLLARTNCLSQEHRTAVSTSEVHTKHSFRIAVDDSPERRERRRIDSISCEKGSASNLGSENTQRARLERSIMVVTSRSCVL